MNWPADSEFVHQLAYGRPTAVRLGDARHHGLPGDTELVQRVPQRPARFRVHSQADWEAEPIVSWLRQAAPTRRAYFVGRILDAPAMIQSDRYMVELWEVPSGRASLAELSGEYRIKPSAKRRQPPPSPGDHVRLWTWEEAMEGEFRPRLAFTTERPKLDRAQRRAIRAVLTWGPDDDP